MNNRGFASILLIAILGVLTYATQNLHRQLASELSVIKHKKQHNRAMYQLKRKSLDTFIGSNSPDENNVIMRHGNLIYIESPSLKTLSTILYMQNDMPQFNWKKLREFSYVIAHDMDSAYPLITLTQTTLDKDSLFNAASTIISNSLSIEKNNLYVSFIGDVEIQKLIIKNIDSLNSLYVIAHGDILIREINLANVSLKTEIIVISTSHAVTKSAYLNLHTCRCENSETKHQSCLKLSNLPINNCRITIQAKFLERSPLVLKD